MFPKTTKILIADDMAMFRQMVKLALDSMQYKNIVEAQDGAQAWLFIEEACRERKPFELIISDWSMPKMKGIDLLRKVREQAWGKNFPFIMLTGETEKTTIVEAIQAGVTQYIVKPFTAESLKQKIKQAYDKIQNEVPI